MCGVEYVPRSGISKYCPACAKKIQREKSNESKRRSRERNRQACIELSAKNDRLSPTSGQILFEDQDIAKTGLSDHRKNHVSFIFQAYNLIDYLNPKENVALTSKLPPLPILERLGLTKEEAKRNVLKLSGGQQQRVAIARALASEAPVILADEPTGNLDEDTARDITEILKESAHKMNKCVVVVTHSNELAKQADVICRLKRGELQVLDRISDTPKARNGRRGR